MRKMLLPAVLLVALAACTPTTTTDTPTPPPSASAAPAPPPAPAPALITLAQFNELRDGVTTYDQATALIGSKGTLTSSAGTMQLYTFQGSGDLGANAILTFQNGRLLGHAQFGLR